jgi:hypothetical protein
MSVFKISGFALFVLAAMILVVPQLASAQGLTEGTMATFAQPVAIPGHVLPAGTYAFVQEGSSVVQVWDKNQENLYATLLTNAAEQPEFATHQEFEFSKAPSDQPQELKAWFLDSGTLGHEFIYK